MPVNVAGTVRRLASEAQRGSTHASRELRSWMAVLEDEIPTSVSDLDAKTRSRLLTRLLSELEAEDKGQVGQDATSHAEATPGPPEAVPAEG